MLIWPVAAGSIPYAGLASREHALCWPVGSIPYTGLAAEVPHLELEILERHRLHIEANRCKGIHTYTAAHSDVYFVLLRCLLRVVAMSTSCCCDVYFVLLRCLLRVVAMSTSCCCDVYFVLL